MADRRPIRRALVSVYDKAGLDHLVAALENAGVEIVSTGSTAAAIEALGCQVTRVEEVTRFPELLDGRVKTLHPAVHAGLLADLRDEGHAGQLRDAGIEPFDLLVSNLYPFERASAAAGAGEDAAAGAGEDEVVEQIDVGGPAMTRAAAKNFASVAVVCDVADYPLVESALARGGTTLDERRELASRAFARTAAYDAAIAGWFARRQEGRREPHPPDAPQEQPQPFPEHLRLSGSLAQALRYGENPHQRAALYTTDGPGLARAVQLAGKELSYNNLLDADAALAIAREHAGTPFAVIVKHTNPCGAALGDTLEAAYLAALEGDRESAFGGIVATAVELDAATARRIAEIHTEVVCAPGFAAGAREALARRKGMRVLEVELAAPPDPLRVRSIAGGLLLQDADSADDDPATWRLVSGPAPDRATLADLAFAWSVCGHVTSNAIVLASGARVVGVGAGQMSRVDSVRLAVAKAAGCAAGSVAASDAYFPFPDGVEALADAGVRAVAQPGGSRRDDEVTAAAAAAGLTMLHTGRRHFRH